MLQTLFQVAFDRGQSWDHAQEDEGVGSARCASRPGHEFWSVSKRQAEQLANYRKRQDSRVSGDEIGWTSLLKKIAGKLVGDGTDARLHVEDRSATKRFLHDAAEPSVIWLVHAEHALGECPKYIWHPPSKPGHGAIVLTQSEYPFVFQYAEAISCVVVIQTRPKMGSLASTTGPAARSLSTAAAGSRKKSWLVKSTRNVM